MSLFYVTALMTASSDTVVVDGKTIMELISD